MTVGLLHRRRRCALLAVLAVVSARAALSQEAIEGLELDVWAPPGLVANPLTLDFDDDGRAFVVTSSRAGLLLDIRQHPDWVPEVHALQTTEDLRAFFRRVMAPALSDENEWLPDYNEDGSHDYRDLTVVAERIYRIEDSDGDGVADQSEIVHEGFNEDIASDIAGGILVHEDSLFVTAAPDLWQLDDTTGDGLYETKTSLSHGYSVHPAFSGHDMSALAIGPDGRLYWKIGDIGLNVVDENGRRWAYPNNGAVLRSELDGTGFEVFAWGLRNTQEMAFDAHGNLISVDNDGDHAGETERVVYIVQGSDAGWRSTWQYGKYTDPANNDYNVWMDEGLYRPQFDGQAAYITPPIAPYHAGPSGFAYNPGTALSESWRDHFFISSFTGQASNASIYAFTLREQGAGFALDRDTQVVSGLLSAGIAFGPDGALYLTDWIRGWGATGEGQLWRLDAPVTERDAARQNVRELLTQDFDELDRRELEALLAHADMRLRLRAQFALVANGDARTLESVAEDNDNPLARLHGLWGLGQLARLDPRRARDIRPFLDDPDSEVRAQAAKVLGDVRDADSTAALIERLADEASRVRFFAAEALGRIGAAEAVRPIAAMLADDDDVYLRSAAVHAFASIDDADVLVDLASHASLTVRLAAVVALRRMQHAGAAVFLDDEEALVVTEAARGINDEGGIVAALPALARALTGPVRDEAFVRRAISANLRLGDGDAAMRLANFASDSGEQASMRVEAVEALGVWATPSTLDRVDGAWLGQLGPRESDAARLAVEGLLPLLEMPESPAAVKVAVLESSVALDVAGIAGYALELLQFDASAEVRLAALESLRAVGGEFAERGVELALASPDADLRMAAIATMPLMPLDDAIKVGALARVIDSELATIGERQSAIRALGDIPSADAGLELASLLVGIGSGAAAPALQLEIVEAARRSDNELALAQLARLGLGVSLDMLGQVLPGALEQGGDADRGRQLAESHPAAQCTRCHTLGESESTIGPSLNGIGARLAPPELVESLLDPGATITDGFGSDAASAMPPMGAILTHRDIRDIVAFLSSLR